MWLFLENFRKHQQDCIRTWQPHSLYPQWVMTVNESPCGKAYEMLLTLHRNTQVESLLTCTVWELCWPWWAKWNLPKASWKVLGFKIWCNGISQLFHVSSLKWQSIFISFVLTGWNNIQQLHGPEKRSRQRLSMIWEYTLIECYNLWSIKKCRKLQNCNDS